RNSQTGPRAGDALGGLAPGDRRHDRDLVLLPHLGPQSGAQADVLVVQVDVHELPKVAVLVEQPVLEARVLGVEGDDSAHEVRGFDVNRDVAVGQAAQGSGDSKLCHLYKLTFSRNDFIVGSISTRRACPFAEVSTSAVFNPCPVTYATTTSSPFHRPARASFASTPIVTPPAVSVKMPSVRARSRIASTISSSDTASTTPPVSRAIRLTYTPSEGLPIAIDRAIVFGLTGSTRSGVSEWNALYTGAQPNARAPVKAGTRSPFTRPYSMT